AKASGAQSSVAYSCHVGMTPRTAAVCRSPWTPTFSSLHVSWPVPGRVTTPARSGFPFLETPKTVEIFPASAEHIQQGAVDLLGRFERYPVTGPFDHTEVENPFEGRQESPTIFDVWTDERILGPATTRRSDPPRRHGLDSRHMRARFLRTVTRHLASSR